MLNGKLLKEKMYVRCSTEENEENPRYFATGQIVSINNFSEMASVVFYDVLGIKVYYEIPQNKDYPLSRISHVFFHEGALVYYRKEKAIVKASLLNKDDGFYYYYLALQNEQIIKVCESEIQASFTDGKVSPIEQLQNYEFQNPMWFLGRSIVSKTMQVINNSLYGFKDLAGCKISLKPYQLKTVMRCLQGDTCRFMIADEVGLGKTIEAISVLKIYLKEKTNQKILILVPEPLIQQWRTELAFKFKLFEGENVDGNNIVIKPIEHLQNIDEAYDFVIADEVHRILNSHSTYLMLLRLSKQSKNILMLSATPIQKRKEEYQKLLTLIQPYKYETMPKEHFDNLLNMQSAVISKVYSALSTLDFYLDTIKDSDEKRTDDLEEIFEELIEELNNVQKLINSKQLSNMISQVSYDSEDFGVEAAHTAIAYVCENYQLEKSIIRNRRSVLRDDMNNVRTLSNISYDIQSDFNHCEYRVYNLLADLIERENLNGSEYTKIYDGLVRAFFSSSYAFAVELLKLPKDIEIGREMIESVDAWQKNESNIYDNIYDYLSDPDLYAGRAVNIIDFIDQNTDLGKILVFANHPATFAYYKKIFEKIFNEQCVFFSANMESDERELSVYKFQNENKCRILLSDESGGEGRNFQHAEALIHIDIPWNANVLEQRIGRLDRVGREEDLPVLSVVAYAQGTVEESLFNVWNDGLRIFQKSQSGLEIIMNEIDSNIVDSVCSDFRYGLQAMVPHFVEKIDDLEKVVKKERYYDLAGYQYQTLNQILERSVDLFIKNETSYFSSAMLGWANLAGFHFNCENADTVRVSASDFSIKSASNALFIPPNMKNLIESKLNQMRNRIRVLNCEKKKVLVTDYIQGTFSRDVALKNDYIHFFAPGDEIFDSIVNNSLFSYKGTSSAMMFLGEERWAGLVFTFKLNLDVAKLYSAGLSPREIDRFRGYIPAEQYIIASPLISSELTDDKVVLLYTDLLKAPKSEQKSVVHLGERKAHNGVSYLSSFKKKFSPDRWGEMLTRLVKDAKAKVKEKVAVRFSKQLDMLRRELLSEVSACKATALFYDTDDISDEVKDKNRAIYNIIATPKIVLDSACYLRIEKSD